MESIKTMISFDEALRLILANVPRVETEEIGLIEATGRVLAEDAVSRVDSPFPDTALKDGYAVLSSDVASARPGNEVALRLVHFQGAGDFSKFVSLPALRCLQALKRYWPRNSHGRKKAKSSVVTTRNRAGTSCFKGLTSGRGRCWSVKVSGFLRLLLV